MRGIPSYRRYSGVQMKGAKGGADESKGAGGDADGSKTAFDLEKAQRLNPVYATRLGYTPTDVGINAAINSADFATAVVKLQSKHPKLVKDGIFGPKTYAAHFGTAPAPKKGGKEHDGSNGGKEEHHKAKDGEKDHDKHGKEQHHKGKHGKKDHGKEQHHKGKHGKEEPAAPEITTQSLGGWEHVAMIGDTLRAIADNAYGEGGYWREIAAANPTAVFEDERFMVGDTLWVPVLEVPVPPIQCFDSRGGKTHAQQPTLQCTDYGNFVIYPTDYPGPLPSHHKDGEPIRKSDYQAELAKREAAAVKKREKTVSKIDDLLSYGVLDWAIRDWEANKAIRLLGDLPFAQLKVAVRQINTSRLIDNTPEKTRHTEAFAKVIVAMSPNRYRGYVQELLSYSLFDWAVTDANVQVVVDILRVLSEKDQIVFLRSLEAKYLSRFARNITSGVSMSNEMKKTVFDALPDSDTDALKYVLSQRFNIELEAWFYARWRMSIKSDWTADGLRALWPVLVSLPPGHVEKNPELEKILRAKEADGSGVYYSDYDTASVSYKDVNAIGGFGSIMVPDGKGGKKDVAINVNTNLFRTVVRHEIGHAVDAKIGASKAGGYVQTAPSAGAWQTYGTSSDSFVKQIILAGGGMSGHGYADEAKYRKAMFKAVEDKQDFFAALKEIDPKLRDPGPGVSGPVAAVYKTDYWLADKKPWYNNNDLPAVGGRRFQQTYKDSVFASFIKSARTDFGVSGYQFRAPGEWFAEAYAAYYSGTERPGTKAGAKLRTRDSATASWFDANVNKGYSIKKEGKGKSGGGT